jgi:hypothetical protein
MAYGELVEPFESNPGSRSIYTLAVIKIYYFNFSSSFVASSWKCWASAWMASDSPGSGAG